MNQSYNNLRASLRRSLSRYGLLQYIERPGPEGLLAMLEAIEELRTGGMQETTKENPKVKETEDDQ